MDETKLKGKIHCTKVIKVGHHLLASNSAYSQTSKTTFKQMNFTPSQEFLEAQSSCYFDKHRLREIHCALKKDLTKLTFMFSATLVVPPFRSYKGREIVEKIKVDQVGKMVFGMKMSGYTQVKYKL